jgi:hypothetical protein
MALRLTRPSLRSSQETGFNGGVGLWHVGQVQVLKMQLIDLAIAKLPIVARCYAKVG